MVMMTAVVIAVGGEGSVSNWIRALNDNGRHGSGGDDGRYPGVGVGGGGGGGGGEGDYNDNDKDVHGGGAGMRRRMRRWTRPRRRGLRGDEAGPSSGGSHRRRHPSKATCNS
jgi:hypothetical protein